MLSSQVALCLTASMDALVVNSSSRALLALAWSSSSSIEGVLLLVLEMAAIGEMLVGMSSSEASVALALAWDEVLLANVIPLASGVESWGPPLG